MQEFSPKNLQEWHDWLSENHQQSESVWLIIAKKGSDLKSPEIEEAIEEALCWGWIDSTPNKVDDQRYKVRFSPRNPKSNWSAVNKARIANIEATGRMQKAGKKMVNEAKKFGTWNALDNVEKGIIPNDLKSAFSNFKKAHENFENFPHSVKRGILEWILNAKREETRQKRIEETAKKAAKNERANQYVRK